MIRKYDTTFIIDGNLAEAQRQALIDRFAASLNRLGGEMDQIVRWGLRTLAYPINKRTHGYYVIFYYNAEPTVIKQFERELRLNENILRFMTLLYEGKHPEYIRDETVSESVAAAAKEIGEMAEEIESEEIDESGEEHLLEKEGEAEGEGETEEENENAEEEDKENE